jgi:hypothetical protein
VRIDVAVRHEKTIERTPPPGRTRLTGVAAVALLMTVAAVGALVGTLEAGLVVGAVLAILLVRRSLAWVVIPLPPLVFVAVAGMACAAAGHDSARGFATALGTTTAKAFPALLGATLLTVVLTVVRNLANRHPRHDI